MGWKCDNTVIPATFSPSHNSKLTQPQSKTIYHIVPSRSMSWLVTSHVTNRIEICLEYVYALLEHSYDVLEHACNVLEHVYAMLF